MNRIMGVIVILVSFIFAASASAQNEGGKPQEPAEEERLSKREMRQRAILERYTPAGETDNCISLNRIRRTHVISDSEILFEMRGGNAYLNTLDYSCPSLGFYEAFSYSTSLSQLCNTDIITVILRSPIRGPSCGLGMFERYERKEEADQ